ncbi:hypothetical protein OTU49_003035 [Cherax quadricarinatus]|uniref:Uncharacterized protein n=1 Tax=Cherax quadricarinatus TaxID=27406 RepID=A0AAW0XK95_CHEQU|nr:trypsin-1-like [Cherax quadricarinatus]
MNYTLIIRTIMLVLVNLSVLAAVTVGIGGSEARTRYFRCGGQASLQVDQFISFRSPNHPLQYPRPSQCIWSVTAPANTDLKVTCPTFAVKPSAGCQDDVFYVFSSAIINEAISSKYYCGTGSLNILIHNNSFAAVFLSKYMQYATYYTGFRCTVSVVKKTVTSSTTSTVALRTTAAPSEISSVCGVKGTSRIVGGEDADVNEWPWQAGIRQMSNGELFCGAVLIDTQWLVTAAHCLVPFNIEDIFISLGNHELALGNTTPYTRLLSIAEKIVHENYNPFTVDNDIGLIRLSGPIQYNEGVRPICLPCQYASYNLSGEHGTVTGWGTLSNNGEQSAVLQKVELPILTTDECQVYMGNTVTDNMICTYLPGQDACKGDSGGPLSWSMGDHYYLLGVVSFGVGCASEQYPGVYTKVTNYLQWIKNKTAINLCPQESKIFSEINIPL